MPLVFSFDGGKGVNSTEWIQTFSGKKFYPLDPDPELICIEDIAHALSNECRFGNHSKKFYSVAQHSVQMAANCFKSTVLRKEALLHDASEAYLSDICRPLKYSPPFAFYREAEERLQRMIYEKWGLHPAPNIAIKEADRFMFNLEIDHPEIFPELHPEFQRAELKGNILNSYEPFEFAIWSPKESEKLFLFAWEIVVKGTVYETDTVPGTAAAA